MSLAPGQLSSGYRLEAPLGSGAEGTVWRAHTPDGRTAAVKVLPGCRARDVAELRWLSRLWHPGVVDVMDALAEPDVGGALLVLDLVEGPALDAWMRTASPDETDLAALRLLEAIQYLQAQGVVHGDLKPSNIVVATRDDGTAQPVIIDFGMAGHRSDRVFRGGTPAYLAPEIVSGGAPDFASDVFALGLSLVQSLSATDRPPRAMPPDLSPSPLLARLLPRMIARRDRRFPDAAAALAAVAAVAPHLAPLLPARTPFVGRAGLMGRLLTEARATLDDPEVSTRLVGIAGARGSGRARLVSELTVRCRLEGIPMVRWTAGDDAVSLTRRILATLGADPQQAEEAVADVGATGLAIRASLPERLAAIVVEHARTTPAVIAGAITGRIDPSVDATIDALVSLGRSMGARVLVVRTGLEASIGRGTPDTVETLRPWSLTDVDRLLERMLPDLGHVARTQLAERVHQETGGTPGPACDLLRKLVEAGRLGDVGADDEAWAGDGSADPRLEQNLVHVLAALAAHGDPASPRALLALGCREAALDELMRSGLVTTDPDSGTLRPASASMARRYLEAMTQEGRRRLHAAWSEVTDDAPHRLRHLLRSGTPVPASDAIAAGRLLAERSPTRALALVEDWIASSPHAGEMEMLRAQLLLKTGLTREAGRTVDGLTRAQDPVVARDARALAADVALADGEPDRALALARGAVELSEHGAASRPRSILAWMLLGRGEVRAAREEADRALVVASGDRETAAALNIRGLAAWRVGAVAAARDDLARARDLLRARQPLGASAVGVNLGLLCMRDGDLDRAAALFDDAERACRRGGHWSLLGRVLGNQGILARLRGSPDTAASLQRESRERLRACGETPAAARALAGEGLALSDAGRLLDAARVLREASEEVRDSSPAVLARVAAARGVVVARLGRPRTARRLVAQAWRAGRRAGDDPRTQAEVLLAITTATRATAARCRRSLLAARAAKEPALVAHACLQLAEMRQQQARTDATLRVLRRAAASHPSVEARRRLLLANCDVPAHAPHHLARGLRAATRRGDRSSATRLAVTCVVHLIRRGRFRSAQKRFRSLRQWLLDMEEGMSDRQRQAFRDSQLGGTAPETLLAAIEDGLRELGRGHASGLAAERRELISAIAALAESDSLPTLLERVLDGILRLTPAVHAAILLLEEDELRLMAARGRDGAPLSDDQLKLSTTVVHETLSSGRSLVVADAASDPEWRGMISVASGGIRALACVPMRVRSRRVGALYLDGGATEAAFDDAELPVIEAFAELAAIAIKNLRRQTRAVTDRDRFALEARTHQALAHAREREARQARAAAGRTKIVGRSAAFRRVDELVSKAARSTIPVLVRGESGTGKELLARALHERSPQRRDGPWVAESCANLTESLFEAELFGHEQGAFTGADQTRPGLIRLADGGTLFLDEIGELPLQLQPRLLRVLQERELRPVGSTTAVPVDFRVVAATNQDLAALVKEGRFREDLYFRLRGIEIEVPPLRARKDDIPLLVEHALSGTGKRVSEDAMQLLSACPWPGNVRQLNNEIARASALCDAPEITPEHLGPEVVGVDRPASRGEHPLPLKLADWERWALEHALRESGGDRKRAARLLGISRSTLYEKLGRHSSA